MPLKDLKTDLKSLKYGKDRLKEGSSGQPYVTKDIDDAKPSAPGLTAANKDFLLRGGTAAATSAVDDGVRLIKYFKDLKSPSGILFIAKQNLLSQTAVETQANLKPNEGVYTPLGTLAQAMGSFAGTHFYKQGLNPIPGGPKSLKTYTDPEVKEKVKGGNDGLTNRLVELTLAKIDTKIDDSLPQTISIGAGNNISPLGGTLLSYGGGPGSILGIGKTDIPVYSERTGKNNNKLFNSGFFKVTPPLPNPIDELGLNDPMILGSESQDGFVADDSPKSPPPYGFVVFQRPPLTPSPDGLSSLESLIKDNTSTVSTKFAKTFGRGNISNLYTGLNSTSTSINLVENSTVYPSFTNTNPSFSQKEGNRIYDNKTVTYTQQQIGDQIPKTPNKSNPGSFQQDFRTKIIDNPNSKFIMGIAPSYNPADGKTIEGIKGSRVHMTSPGLQGDRKNYVKGKMIGNRVSVVDEINFQPIYQSSAVRETGDIKKNDLVKFRIAAIDKTNPSLKQFIHFRAFITNFADNYGAQWTGQKFMGRGEEFYKYGGFSRDISIDFTVAAQSKPELMAQYKKLNFLASNLAPTYSDKGYMGGPLVQLTMGGWCFELPGFIGSLSLGVPQESPWEIGISTSGDTKETDKTVKEMPHIVNVAMKFTPIHRFRPEKQELDFPSANTNEANPANEVAIYGPQRYIQLTNGRNNNYVPVSLADAQKGIGGGPEDKQFTTLNNGIPVDVYEEGN